MVALIVFASINAFLHLQLFILCLVYRNVSKQIKKEVEKKAEENRSIGYLDALTDFTFVLSKNDEDFVILTELKKCFIERTKTLDGGTDGD